jgi:iron complex outermembrane receptor protein
MVCHDAAVKTFLSCCLALGFVLLPVPASGGDERSLLWSPSAITVFTRDDIRGSGATSLTDLLRRVPGFDVYDVKPTQALIGARALTSNSNNKVLLLIDGREIVLQLIGGPPWDALGIELEEVERIEVIRNPGSARYGANAFSAVVSVTTVPERPAGGVDVFLAYGEGDYHRMFGGFRHGLALGDGRLSFAASLSGRGKRNPHRSGPVFLVLPSRLNGHLRYQEDGLDVALHSGVMISEGWTYIQTGDLFLSEFLNYMVMGKVRLDLGEKTRLKLRLHHNNYRGDFDTRMDIRVREYDIKIAEVPLLLWNENIFDGKVWLEVQLDDDLLLAGGGQVHYTFLDSTGQVVSDDDEFGGAGFVDLRWRAWDVLQINAALRLDLNTDTREKATLSPRAAVVLRPWPNHAFRLGYGRAHRKPAFFEQRIHQNVVDFDPFTPEIVEMMAEQLGNEDLSNETLDSFEAGWRAHLLGGSLRLSVDLFYNVYRNMVHLETDIPLRLGLPNILESTFRFGAQEGDRRAPGFGAGAQGKPRGTLRPRDRAAFRPGPALRVGLRDAPDRPTRPARAGAFPAGERRPDGGRAGVPRCASERPDD